MDYVPFLENTYLPKNERKTSIKHYKLVDNTKENQTYKKGKKIIYVIRGTNTWKDMTANYMNTLTELEDSKRYLREEKKLKRTISKYPDCDIIVVGHSLGGSLAIELGEREKRISEIHAYNPFSLPHELPLNFLNGIACWLLGIGRNCHLRKKLYVYRNLLDPASIGRFLNSTEVVLSPHIHFVKGFKKDELYSLAKKRGKKVTKKTRKDDIIKAIIES